ncbi:MAG: hypothetical protein U0P45_05180 [Acidimicrobiales bacterium]
MSMTVAESSAIVAELRRARRKQRVASIHWVDALYQVYITGIVSIVAVIVVSGFVGDGKVSAATVDQVTERGPAALGLLVAVSILMGLRSGSRGGPLALERPDVRHVLLSPVDRGVALRGPAWRQLRFLSTAAAAIGAVAGQLALRRLPGNPAEWIAMGAVFAVTVVWIGFGCALLAAGVNLKTWIASLVGLVLVGWSAADLAGRASDAPTTIVGHLATWPLELQPLALVGVVVGLALVFFGMRFVAGTSLEAAERRTALVGQLRFAVTLQDLRTVMVLRRQLAQEHPRPKPWIKAWKRQPRFPVWQRGVRSVARWPVSRIVRVLLLATLAGLSLRGIWSGTTTLIVLGGIAMWVAALDAAEPLGQEVDHPGRTDAFPVPRGEVFVRHLPLVLTVSIVTGLLAAVVAAVPVGDAVPWGPALVAGAMGGVLAACGAAISVVQGAPDPVDTLQMMTPEIAGTRTVYRTALPPAMAIAGLTPILMARRAYLAGDGDGMASAVNLAAILSFVAVLVGGWVRFRDQIHKFMAEASDQVSPTKVAERQREERLAAEAREAEALAQSRRIGDEAKANGGAKPRPQQRAKQAKPQPAAPPGVQGGSSAKPIGRKRDQT